MNGGVQQTMKKFPLPKAVVELCRAHLAVKEHFASSGLTFTLDGKLVGDIGEALAAELFGITLCGKRTPGVDGWAPDGRSVLIKATGHAKSGPAFSPGEGIADHLLFLRIDFHSGTLDVAYNGREAPVRALLPSKWSGTKVVPLAKVLSIAADAPESEQMQPVKGFI